MTGWRNQHTGDLGQAVVQAVLSRSGLLVGTLTPDPGEDFWAEVDGRRAIAQGEFPLRALFQVRATTDDTSECTLDIEIDQVRRWAAQPLPVFLIGISTPKETIFSKLIDDIVSDDLSGRDPFAIATKTARVRLPPVVDVGAAMRDAIEKHYSSSRLSLEGLSETQLTSHYFEVLARREPTGAIGIPIATWTVLWKSPPRPQYFATMVSELIRRARLEHMRTVPRPVLFFFNVFRSTEDRHYNVATARVEVVNPDHPDSVKLRHTLAMPNGYSVRRDRDSDESREFWQSITMSPNVFRAYAEPVGQMLDTLTVNVLRKSQTATAIWDDDLDRAFNMIKETWDNQTLAPPECRILERVLDEQFQNLLEHRLIWKNTRGRFTDEVRHEMLSELEAKLAQCLRSWAVVLRAER